MQVTVAQSTFVDLKLTVCVVNAVKWPSDDNALISVTWARVASVRPIFADISAIKQTMIAKYAPKLLQATEDYNICSTTSAPFLSLRNVEDESIENEK